MRPRAWAPAVASILGAFPVVVQAQSNGLSVAGVACRARDVVAFLGSNETTAGWCVGALGLLKLGPLVLEGSGFRARQLEPTQGTALTRDGGEVRGLLGLAPVRWVAIEGGFAVRAFSSAAGYQRWLMPSGGVKVAAPLGDPALTAYVRAHYLPPMLQKIPAGQVSGDTKWDLGLVAESGVRIAPRKSPLFLGASYRLERYDFPGGVSGRLEQFDVVSIYGGFRVEPRQPHP